MEKLSINVNIGNRLYPLKIDTAEEELIRKSAKRVNENVKKLESTYEVSDKQDLLAMTALLFSNKALQASNNVDDMYGDIYERLNEMENDLSEYLNRMK